jgi:hypothetical protein
MRNVIIFALLIIGPLFYLWEHAYSFRLHQDTAQLQEQRQRMKEVCDSLSASIGTLNSNHRIEAGAIALGMKPRIARRALLVPEALALGGKKADKASATGKSPAATNRKADPAGKKVQGTGKGATASSKSSVNGQKPIAGKF